MAVPVSYSGEAFRDLERWISEMQCSLDTPLTASSDIFPSLQGLLFQVNLESLSNLQSSFVRKYSAQGSPQPFLSDTLWSSFIQSWITKLTKQFILDLVQNCYSSGSSTLGEHVNDSNMIYSVSNGCAIDAGHSAGGAQVDVTTLKVKAESDHEQSEKLSSETLCESDSRSDGYNGLVASEVCKFSSGGEHKYRLTKSVPSSFAYSFRGVECLHCFAVFRGVKCVDNLVRHTKLRHKKFASSKMLKKLRAANTPEQVIGAGMRYCGCPSCSAESLTF